MKKGLLKLDSMGEYEKEKGYASYRTIIDRFIDSIVLCNKIIEIDTSVYDNMVNYEKDDEIFQWYLCNLNDYEEEWLEEAGIILSYSDLLECDLLCVDHYGTSWDYVLTNVKLFDTYDELEKYENK